MTIPQPKTRDDLIALLSITDPDELQALYDAAYAVKAAGVGRVVYYRGLVEFSNYCIKDCKYCGIRKSNDEVEASIRRAKTSWPWPAGPGRTATAP